MQFRVLGRTRLSVSVLAFGAGPVSTLLVGADERRQRTVVAQAIERGVNWFDTAAGYGAGRSEANLGRVLEELGVGSRVHVATKVRLTEADLGDVRGAVRRSVEESLRRLRLSNVTLLQLHNSIATRRGEEPSAITPDDVLGPGGIADVFAELRSSGLVRHTGLTGIGRPASLREVVRSGAFETIQVPYHLLNPSAGSTQSGDVPETDYGNIIADCAAMEMGVFAIRVFAGGALVGNPPSPHTLTTPYFPLDLYERDCRRAAELQERLGPERPLAREAVRFVLSHPQIHSAIIGFGDTSQIDEALQALHSLPASAPRPALV